MIARVTGKSARILLDPLQYLVPLLLESLRRYRQAGFHLLGKERYPELLKHPPVLKRLGTEPDQPGVTPLALFQLLVPGCQHLERFLIFQVLPVQSTDPMFRRLGVARVLS